VESMVNAILTFVGMSISGKYS